MKKGIVAIACAMALLLAVGDAQAATVSLGYGSDDLNFVGSIVDGVPSDPANEIGYINNLITLGSGSGPVLIGTETYSRVYSSMETALTGLGNTRLYRYKDEADDATPGISAFAAPFAGSFYVLGKYDGENAGSLVWFVTAGIGDSITALSLWGPGDKAHDLSHLSVYSNGSPVPVPGTLILFGSGLVGLATVARRRLRK